MPISIADLDPNTPVVVGVGQASERLTDPGYEALGEADLAARAVTAAFDDAGASDLASSIDTIAAIRSFEISSPLSSSPLGRPDNMPRAVAKRVGADPRRAVQAVTGGQTPQTMLTELAGVIAAGDSEAVVIFGAEVMSTVRHLQSKPDNERPSFAEEVGGQLEDRGFGVKGIITVAEVRHGLASVIPQYALLENARRHNTGLGREEYAAAMGELFAPFTKVAAANPHSAAPTVRDAAELVTVTPENRVVADPFTRYIVARDQVNQSAAVVVMSIRAAQAAGIDPSKWVFLHGHAETVERTSLNRPDLGAAPAAPAAVRHALEVAEVGLHDIDVIDIYSCFPIAVFNILDGLGLATDDPRGLTVTGGLPFFGGPGNNYSLHAIAEVVTRVRQSPGDFGLVVANGGVLSKHAAGVYSTTPAPWRADNSAQIQARLDAVPSVPTIGDADGPAILETYTVIPSKSGKRTGVVIGRLIDHAAPDGLGARFVANLDSDDDEFFDHLLTSDDPAGTKIVVRSFDKGNRVKLTEAAMNAKYPAVAPAFRDSYEHIEIRRDGHLLEVTINRPDARNALNPAANAELDSVFDAYFADDDLWVAILTGKGDKAFSAGNDLTATTSPAALSVPKNGFAGLTARASLPKPVIAAVNGFALGGGCEIAMACHIIVADEEASFGLPEVKVGLAAAAGGLVRLPRMIPPALARDMILTGRRISATEAAAAGLVSRIAPAGKVLETARGVAEEILAASPTSVRASITTMEQSDAITDTVEAVRASTNVLDSLIVSGDTLEGIMAFVMKRTPEWKGR
ncbi:acetyl-CoA acetyltransferase [Gordonia amicalis]|uniref:acetyl-CoA acetyltransferase n=1 Tax=Gordonia amicalis TaxID=89053 RepID=UPI0015F735B2|nr:acetyl-CoA acetyltransferase [Gordonia amicalis]MBA5845947.1 enoyl-CoA hydratase/isomerase family protein [Gordonia amicalis]UKO91278.1 enoyl-CoA hydratase-related protein [Gordonia amicalis]